jgi:hypothetical protein
MWRQKVAEVPRTWPITHRERCKPMSDLCNEHSEIPLFVRMQQAIRPGRTEPGAADEARQRRSTVAAALRRVPTLHTLHSESGALDASYTAAPNIPFRALTSIFPSSPSAPSPLVQQLCASRSILSFVRTKRRSFGSLPLHRFLFTNHICFHIPTLSRLRPSYTSWPLPFP